METTEFDSATQCAMAPKEVSVGEAVKGKKIAIVFIGSLTISSAALILLVASRVSSTLEGLAIDTASDRFERLMDTAGVLASYDPFSESMTVWSNTNMYNYIPWVFANLLNTSAKYTPVGGEISVRVTVEQGSAGCDHEMGQGHGDSIGRILGGRWGLEP